MRNNWLTNLLLLILIALVLIFNLIPKNSSNRYSMYVQGSEFPYEIIKIDRETGKMWLLFLDEHLHFYQRELEIGGTVVKKPLIDLDSIYGETP